MSNVVRLLPVVLAVAAVVTAAPAPADPPVLEPGTPCPAAADGALAGQPGIGFIRCGSGHWSPMDDMAHGDRWLTYGPMLELRGPAQPNPQLAEGNWVADPQDSSTRCSIVQVVLVNPPDQTVAQLATGKAGKQLTVDIQSRVVAGQLSGNCLWQRQS